jgi:hypothetical protein
MPGVKALGLLGLVVCACGTSRFGANDGGLADGLAMDVQFGDVWSSTQCSEATYTTYTPGADGVLGTSDDVSVEADAITFIPGPDPSQVFSAIPSTDVVSGTALPSEMLVTAYDTAGNYVSLTHFTAGSDGIYGTKDDVETALDSYHHIGGVLHDDTFADNAGPDGVWGTADDHIEASILFRMVEGSLTWALSGTSSGPEWDRRRRRRRELALRSRQLGRARRDRRVLPTRARRHLRHCRRCRGQPDRLLVSSLRPRHRHGIRRRRSRRRVGYA